MKQIAVFEDIIANSLNHKDLGINSTMFWAYRNSQRYGNELLNFGGIIWEDSVDSIISTLNDNYITEFTISSVASGLMTVLAMFDKQGFKVAGMTEVNSEYKNFTTGEVERIPALVMKKEAQ